MMRLSLVLCGVVSVCAAVCADALAGETGAVEVEVEGAWQVEGTVRRQDGSPIAGARVTVQVGADATRETVTDEDGGFVVDNLPSADTAHVLVHSVLQKADGSAGFVLLDERDVELAGPVTALDLSVRTVQVELAIDLYRRMWPFRRMLHTDHIVAVWVGHRTGSDPDTADVYVDLAKLKATSHGALGSDRYIIDLPDLPPDRWITVGCLIHQAGPSMHVVDPYRRRRGPSPPDEVRYSCRSWDAFEVGSGPTFLRCQMWEKHAMLSRILCFGVPAALILLVLVPVLVWKLRRSRARREATTDSHGTPT